MWLRNSKGQLQSIGTVQWCNHNGIGHAANTYNALVDDSYTKFALYVPFEWHIMVHLNNIPECCQMFHSFLWLDGCFMLLIGHFDWLRILFDKLISVWSMTILVWQKYIVITILRVIWQAKQMLVNDRRQCWRFVMNGSVGSAELGWVYSTRDIHIVFSARTWEAGGCCGRESTMGKSR